MNTEDLDFLLSQYADGVLPEGQRAVVEARLSTDPGARATLAEYRELTQLLTAPPLDLNWDRLAAHLSAAVAEQDRAAEPVAVAGRIGWSRWMGAIAAVSVVAVTAALLAHHRPAGPSVAVNVPNKAPLGPAVAVITGPTVEHMGGPAVAQVSIGPSRALASRGGSWRYAEGVVSRPPTVVIAGAEGLPMQDYPIR